ncbi:MAG: hypothetical protein ABIJ59_01190 [Pseudomonadota bacterium]
MNPAFQEYSNKIDDIFGVMIRVCYSLHGQRNDLNKLATKTGVPLDTTLSTSSFSNYKGNIIHRDTIEAQIKSMEEGGFDEILIGNICASFIYSLWEDKYRKDFAEQLSVEKNRIKSKFFCELSTYRHSIVHNQAFGTSRTDKLTILPRVTRRKPLRIDRHILEIIVTKAKEELLCLSLPGAVA